MSVTELHGSHIKAILWTYGSVRPTEIHTEFESNVESKGRIKCRPSKCRFIISVSKKYIYIYISAFISSIVYYL